ncbi:hypothetical protein H0H81_005672, partial [Sphagnurus paluster]
RRPKYWAQQRCPPPSGADLGDRNGSLVRTRKVVLRSMTYGVRKDLYEDLKRE